MAIAILTMGASAVGYLSGVTVGGFTASAFGWRVAFFLAGGVGLLLAMICRITLSEPRCKFGFPARDPKAAGLKEAVTYLRHKRSFVFVLLGQSLCTIFATAASLFIPSFMIRSLHASITQVSGMWGLAVTAADFLGGLLGGWLGGLLGKRDVRWYAWLASLASASVIPIYWMALDSTHLGNFIALDFVAELLYSVGLPAAFSALHAVCGNRHRAMAVALLQLCFYLIGFGLGPSFAGALSDVFSAAYGQESLRYSLTCMLGVLVPTAAAFAWAARTMTRDKEDY
jgi:MFS family permease